MEKSLKYSVGIVRAILAAACLFAAVADAAALSPRDCVKLPTANGRLACFDKILPVQKGSAAQTDANKELRDITVEENLRVEKRIHSICKGC